MNHRAADRHPCDLGLLVIVTEDLAYAGRSRDISGAGIYIETTFRARVGARYTVVLISPAREYLRAPVEVIHVDGSRGFGAKFNAETERGTVVIQTFVQTVLHFGQTNSTLS